MRTRNTTLLRVTAVLIAIGIWVVDQMTKELAIRYLDPDNPPSFFGGFLKFRLIFNPGAAFSMGESFTVLITIFSLVVLAVVAIFLVPRIRTRLTSVGIGLLMGGILGNVTDRLLRPPGPFEGYVVDFISLPHFAIFNVADICITSAAVLLVIASFLAERSEQKAKEETEQSLELDAGQDSAGADNS